MGAHFLILQLRHVPQWQIKCVMQFLQQWLCISAFHRLMINENWHIELHVVVKLSIVYTVSQFVCISKAILRKYIHPEQLTMVHFRLTDGNKQLCEQNFVAVVRRFI
jgi:hypothetical protein